MNQNSHESENEHEMESGIKTEVEAGTEAKAEVICLRPHHGLCLLNFRGKGYSDEFSRNMGRMQEYLTGNPKTMVRITEGADDLCARCPNRRGSACTSEHPPLFDGNVLAKTGFGYGQELTWEKFSQATRPLSLYQLEETCPDCQWLSLCKKIAADYLSSTT